uniref:L-idonate 5-dehydrogenase n=1 Tax=Vaginimicrobium propionicum TaxID=1871034 RepID=UPI00097052A2|nr:L-idonate 5-dehydrogenase [Vaginimicrobium propionicum]
MKAVVVHAANDLRIDDVPDPVCGSDDVLVEMEWGGICGSDLAYVRTGLSGTAQLREPLILGHEVGGKVAEVGKNVAGINVGEPVTIHPATLVGDHTMPADLKERTNLWPEVRYFGSAAFLPHEQGGFSQYRIVRPDQLRPIPDGVSTKEAALAEPLGVAIHAVNRAGNVSGKRVLVNGSGPVGALVVATLKQRGAKIVYAADLSKTALEIAGRMGADDLVHLAAGDKLPVGVEISFEASGAPQAIGDVLLATRRGGTVIQVGNLPGKETPISLGQLVTREINYLGSYRFIDEITDALEMLKDVDVSPLMTHEFDLADAVEAFRVAADRSTGSSKVMLKLS